MQFFTKSIYLLTQLLRNWGVNFNEKEDPRVIKMKEKIQEIGGVIDFKVKQYPGGLWTAEATKLDGLMTGGTSLKNMNSTIKDAIFTYFDIPPHLCNDKLLRSDKEPVTIRQRVYVV